ncbi:ABC transporter substrate-binding protein [Streptomyces bomunensis]|uniref:ABC transporter substrate-binding protein n=2 Tax=Streptomyces montanisoli TaxID=2798581 RepID=A0A940MAD3_9ACTN|nr:ABC transporter substrate-binding protein [Streptomyces montanisoli]
MRRSSRPARRHRFLPAAVLASVLALSSCSAGGATRAADTGDLTMQFEGPPVSLDPAKAGNGGSTTFVSLAYDPLIYLSGDGRLVPDLATSWGFAGDSNTVFDLRLRDGVTFSDGAPLTARAVVASMRYFLHAGGGLVGNVGHIAKVEALGPMKVRVTFADPNPEAPMAMTQYNGMGNIIGPKGLAHPASLLTASDGTGQYVYDGQDSIAGNRYVYRRNDHYFRPSAQQFDTVSIKVIGDPNAVLAAAKTGQVQYANGSANTVDAARAAGLRINTAPFYNWALNLVDRTGKVSPPLADSRVRHAIALAFDRSTIAHGLAGAYASASDQIMLPGTDGYKASLGYRHNVARAKRLLAQAGYPHGFRLTVLTQSIIDPNTNYSQAIAAALGDIGIDVTLRVESTGIAQFTGDALSKQYAATIFPNVGASMQATDLQIMSGVFNPFGSSDKELNSLLARAAAQTDAGARTDLYQQASRRLQQLAWFVPVFATKNISYSSPDLEHVTSSVVNPNPVPVGPTAAYSWRLK